MRCMAMVQGGSLVKSFRQNTAVFHTEMYATKVCMVENLDTNYSNRNMCILSDCLAAVKALSNHQITSELV
jgi:hypothetical protein